MGIGGCGEAFGEEGDRFVEEREELLAEGTGGRLWRGERAEVIGEGGEDIVGGFDEREETVVVVGGHCLFSNFFCWEFPAANGRRAFSRSSLMRFTIQLTDL